MLVGVPHQVLQVLRVDGVQDVHEVLARRAFVFGKRVGEELHQIFVALELWVEVLDRQLVVVRDVNRLDLGLLQQLFLL